MDEAQAVQAPVASAGEATAGSRRRLAAGLAAVLVLLAAGGVVANASLSSRFSPEQATLDYFAAESRGDAEGMVSNATFLRGDGSVNQFFSQGAVTAMLQRPENLDIRDVKIVTTHPIDASTSKVTVSMRWSNINRTATYTVRKDPKHLNYFFYNSWRVDIPYSTISVKLPSQPGALQVDGIFVPFDSSSTSIKVIAGYHDLTMDTTSFYDAETNEVNGVDADPIVAFAGNVSAGAMAAARDSIKDSLNNHCDAAKTSICTGHTYQAPDDGSIWYLTMPGYGEIDYKTYLFTFSRDPTSDIKLVVTAERTKMTATGTCATTLTVDGSRQYAFTGTWSANLTWNAGAFSARVTFDCSSAKA